MKRSGSDESDDAQSSPPSPIAAKRTRVESSNSHQQSQPPWLNAAPDLRARLEQVPLAFVEGRGIEEIATNEQLRDMHYPRDDGVLVDRVTRLPVNDEPAFGPAFVQNTIDREKLLDADPNYQLAKLIAGATNRPVERMFSEQSVRNRELYFRQAEAYMNHERNRRMEGAKAKKEQAEALEALVQRRIGLLLATDALASDQLYYANIAGELASPFVLPQHQLIAAPPRSLALLTAVVAQYRVVYRLAAALTQTAAIVSVQPNLCTREELERRRVDNTTTTVNVDQILMDIAVLFFPPNDQRRALVNTYCDAFLDEKVKPLVSTLQQNPSGTSIGTSQRAEWVTLFECLSFYLFMRDQAGATMTRLQRMHVNEVSSAVTVDVTADVDGSHALGALCISVPRLALSLYTSMKERRQSTWVRLLQSESDGKAPMVATSPTAAAAVSAAAAVNDTALVTTTAFTTAERDLVEDKLYNDAFSWSRETDGDISLLPPTTRDNIQTATAMTQTLREHKEVPGAGALEKAAVVNVLWHWDYYSNDRNVHNARSVGDAANFLNPHALLAWLAVALNPDVDFSSASEITSIKSNWFAKWHEILLLVLPDTIEAIPSFFVSIVDVGDEDAFEPWRQFVASKKALDHWALLLVLLNGTLKVVASPDGWRVQCSEFSRDDYATLQATFPKLSPLPVAGRVVPVIEFHRFSKAFNDAFKAFVITPDNAAEETASGYSRVALAMLGAMLSLCPLAAIFSAAKRVIAADDANRHRAFQYAWRRFNDQAAWVRQAGNGIGPDTILQIESGRHYPVGRANNNNTLNDYKTWLFYTLFPPRFSFRAAEAAISFAHRCSGEFWAFTLATLHSNLVVRLGDSDDFLTFLYKGVQQGNRTLFLTPTPSDSRAPPASLWQRFRGWMNAADTSTNLGSFAKDAGGMSVLYAILGELVGTNLSPLLSTAAAAGSGASEPRYNTLLRAVRAAGFLWPEPKLRRLDPVLQLGEVAWVYGQAIGRAQHEHMLVQIDKLRESLARIQESLLDVVGNEVPGAAGLSAQQRFLRDLYVEPPEHALRAALTGVIVLREDIIESMQQAMETIRQHVPSLAGLALEDVTRAPSASGLPGAFARLVAAFINQKELSYPHQYNTVKQHRLNPSLRLNAVNALKCFTFHAPDELARCDASRGGRREYFALAPKK